MLWRACAYAHARQSIRCSPNTNFMRSLRFSSKFRKVFTLDTCGCLIEMILLRTKQCHLLATWLVLSRENVLEGFADHAGQCSGE